MPFEHHVFYEGKHGISLADEDWANGNYGGYYTMKQLEEYIKYCRAKKIAPMQPYSAMASMPENVDFIKAFMDGMRKFSNPKPQPLVAVWPELVDRWLMHMFPS